MPINPKIDPYVLEGRIVTMGSQKVIDEGALYIKAGIIEAVKTTAEAAPAGYQHAPRVRTGDTIYPGLIELHNHLSYNAIPLWDVPKKYANNSQWRRSDAYRREITKPVQVLGGTPGIVEALIRFVEVRAMLGGVTTSQGITLYSRNTIKPYYDGLVRNVEQPLLVDLPAAGTNISNPRKNQAEQYLQTLSNHRCYLQHISEGVDDTARKWFLNLHMENGDWALNEAFCGIHSTALHEEDFQVIADHGGSMLWSPLSNYMLYGETARLQAVKDAKLTLGLGSDWAPSGSKNLLGEIKVAWLASEQQGSVFTAEELVAMVTTNPAKIARWDEHLGSIEVGKRADLLVINGQQGNVYEQLIDARETSVTLVVIDGVPRVGQPRLMDDFGPGTENIYVGKSKRVLNLAQESAHPLVAALTLQQATQRLKNAMANLPQLAANMSSGQGGGMNLGLNSLISSASADGSGEPLKIQFDFEEEDYESDLTFAVAAKPLSYYVTKGVQLEPITVMDDAEHFVKLAKARNLPEFIKKGLPPYYGKSVPLPDSGDFLKKTGESLAPEILQTTRDLATFMRLSGELSLADRKRIVEQAMLIIGENYVHLPLKHAMHAVDPLQRLRLLKYQLNESVEGELSQEIEFHTEISDIFNSLRDLHTGYRLPAPFAGKVAWLPFLVEEIEEDGRPKFIVSRLIADAGPESFKVGVEVTHWNGMPIQQKIKNNAEQHAGSNSAARWARGINTLTIRPLGSGLPPQEEWVNIRYVDQQDQVHDWSQEWYLFEPNSDVNGIAWAASMGEPQAEISAISTAVGVDIQTDEVQQSRKVLFAPLIHRAVTRGLTPIDKAQELIAGNEEIATQLPGVFRAKTVSHNGESYGYIRIFTFGVNDADSFVKEFIRLAEQLPDTGLVIDVRGNGGGLIYAAEQLLQVLTPRYIEPERAQFINRPINLALCRNHAKSTRINGLSLHQWIASMKQSVQTGATFSQGFSITPEQKCNELGQHYFGPVVLVVDPLCYSATDIFAAGFKDHNIGPIVGTGSNTGAGGANVWSHSLLSLLMQPHQVEDLVSPYKPLPHGSDLRVAIRRTLRVGDNEGAIIEDMGIVPDKVHRVTREDVLHGNKDLIAAAIELISESKRFILEARVLERGHALPIVELKTQNVDRIDATVGNVQLRSIYPTDGYSRIDLQQELTDSDTDFVNIEIRAYSANRLVVRTRKQLELSHA